MTTQGKELNKSMKGVIGQEDGYMEGNEELVASYRPGTRLL